MRGVLRRSNLLLKLMLPEQLIETELTMGLCVCFISYWIICTGKTLLVFVCVRVHLQVY